ncbi:hypothetical protein C0993_004122, partial [Termitomyces sp. T159_Od127]
KSEVDVQRCITKNLEVLAQEGLGLGETTSAGKGLQQGPRKEQGAKERTPKSMAGVALEAAASVTPRAPAGGTKGLALPVKKLSSTNPASKRRGRKAPKYEVSFET